ncbi:MAG: DUF4347 domain-containing protein, partial [Gammaproteobacteria bacterium]|nr:DUF4347 domain-containing protein [Gammaproteobacteria bacterium]
MEQDYVEEPAVIVDLEPELELSNSTAVQPPAEEAETVEGTDPQETAANPAGTDSASQESVEPDGTDAVESTELVFVNSNVDGYQQLVNDIEQSDETDRTIEVVILDDEKDGILQVTESLDSYKDLNAVHFLTHGAEGRISLGDNWLNSKTLEENSDIVAGWGNAFDEKADILFYGCNIAGNDQGQVMLDQIAQLTGADVTASDDPTGAKELGGDWDLEYDTGSIETDVAVSDIVQADYEAVLATYIVDNTNDSGAGSLRQAIIDANANGGSDNIHFDISDALVDGAHTISLLSALPDITETVVIDGTQDSDFSGTPIIVLDGSGAGAGVDGLVLATGSDGSTIRGLVINQFSDDGIEVNSDGNTIEGNYIGTDVSGSVDLGNTSYGISLTTGAENNTIGGTTSTQRNVISGNDLIGVNLYGATTTGNVIQGNYIGVSADGTTALGNTLDGIRLSYGAYANTIGGDQTAGEGNVISGNLDDGIAVSRSGTDNNLIYGNYIGTDSTGLVAVANARHGIVIYDDAQGTQIGGTGTGEGNVISGNTNQGVLINGNGQTTSGNVLVANYIGVGSDGTTALGNGSAGVQIDNSASDNTIGSAVAGDGNLIANNTGAGIEVQSDAGTGNSFLGNLIYDNTGIGIDLANDGVTANDANDADTGANNLQNFPVITAAATAGSQIEISGTLDTDGLNQDYRIEFFATGTPDGSGHGEAERYLGYATVTTDGSGDATFNEIIIASVTAGEYITATATVDNGGGSYSDTSEFAQNVAATTATNDRPLFGSGTPNFAAATIGTSADNPLMVATADVDGDGDLDVLSASWNDDKIAWYENDGNQNFTAHTITTAANGASAVTTADVDGDGDMDVLSASGIDDKIAWYENDGSENFTAHTITATATDARSVAVADVDGDGDLDVLSASEDDDKIAWYENDGNENFTAHTITTAADAARSVTTADVDGDGDVDVLSASNNDDKIAWYENDGNENFTAHTITVGADGARSVTTADVDGDGDLDVLSASWQDLTVAWYENDGSENFTAHSITTSASGAGSVSAADVDGDGDIDVLSSAWNDNEIAWYENDGSENFTTHSITNTADGANSVATGDLDGDGDLDVLSSSMDDDTIAWYESDFVTLDGTPNFTEGGAAVVLDADVVVSDVELDALNSGNGNYNGASLTLVRNGGASAEDVFSNSGLLSALTESGALVYNGTTIGTVTTNSGGTLVLSFNSNATSALVDSTLQSIAYSNSSVAPPAMAKIVWSFDDGNTGSQGTGGALQGIGSTTVTITPVNTVPTISSAPTITVDEDTPYALTIADFNFSDVDGTLDHVQIMILESAGSLKLSGVDVTQGQTITAADITAGNLTYTPVPGASGTA